MKRVLLGCLLAAAVGASFAAQKATPREPSGYRMDDYGALVPATLKGALVLSTSKAFELWSQKAAVFVDVLPRPPRPAGLPKEAVWRDAPRQDIPGSIWLPDTGYGELAAPTQRYFEDGLSRATHDDKSKALVLYSRKNCWSPGTRPSARCRLATPMFPGIQTAPMAGPRRENRWNLASPSLANRRRDDLESLPRRRPF